MQIPIVPLLLLLVLAGCGQDALKVERGERGPPGSEGPAGPAGPAGPPGTPGTVIRTVDGDCSTSSCIVACEANEKILNAYAINPGGTFTYEADNRATFRPQRPGVAVKVVLACIPK
jgi:hypothetical protein